MLLQKESHASKVEIKGYKDGEIQVSGNRYTHPIIIDSNNVKHFDQAESFQQLSQEMLHAQLNEQVEVLLIGTGAKHLFLASEIIKSINDKGIAIEIMSTRHACHTFQVLNYEKRQVMALLFP
jgi:uncharacterized protein